MYGDVGTFLSSNECDRVGLAFRNHWSINPGQQHVCGYSTFSNNILSYATLRILGGRTRLRISRDKFLDLVYPYTDATATQCQQHGTLVMSSEIYKTA
jgi:hypothetical protein